MRIAILSGTSRYDALEAFVQGLVAALKRQGHEVLSLGILDPARDEVLMSRAPPVQFAISFNARGVELRQGARPYFDAIGVPLVAIMVDHPFYHLGRIDDPTLG